MAEKLFCPALVVGLVIVGTGLASGTDIADWASTNYDISGTRNNTGESTLGVANVGTAVLDWAYTSGNNPNWGTTGPSDAIVVDNVVYVVNGNNQLSALDATSGDVIWTDPGFSANDDPQYSDGVLYISTGSGIEALSAANGSEEWFANVAAVGCSMGQPLYVNGTIYVEGCAASGNAIIYSMTASTGALNWEDDLTELSASSFITYGDDQIFVEESTADNIIQLFSYDPASGAQNWESPGLVGGSGASQAVYSNGYIYLWGMAGSADGQAAGLSASSGAVIWTYPLYWFNGPVAVAGKVLYADMNSTTYALNLSILDDTPNLYPKGPPSELDSAAVEWTSPSCWCDTGLTVANGVAYFVNGSDDVTAASTTNGSTLWTAPSGAAVQSFITVADGQVIFSAGGYYAYGLPAVPVVTSVSPSSGPTAGQTTVTISGTGFTGATKVLFGTIAATSYTVVSATEITAISPAQGVSVHNIYVTTPGGTSRAVTADLFTYN